METGFRRFSFLQECRTKWSALALCSVIGAVLGVLLTDAFGYHYLLLMRMAAKSRVSIVGTAVSVWIPFVVSFIILIHSKPWLVYLLCTTHIFRFACIGLALQRSFDSAGWLIRGLLQFPDLCLIPVLLYVAVCKLNGTMRKRLIVCCIVFGIIIGMMDYILISPFLADLMNDYETMGRYAFHVGLDRCL